MFNILRKRIEENEEGFTLIELLVVIIIIGILAAIAIPTFLSQRQKGWDAASQSELRNAAVAMESFATSNNGSYAFSLDQLETEGFNLSTPFAGTTGFSIKLPLAAGGSAFCIEAAHSAQTGVVWALGSAEGAPQKGTCGAGGAVTPATTTVTTVAP